MPPDQNHKRIIAEAKRLFFQYGFRRVTMDEIAANLRISKKTLYSLFDSKNDLIRAVIDAVILPHAACINRLADEQQTDDADDAVLRFIGGVMQMIDALGRDISEPMLVDLKTMPDIWREIDERRMQLLSRTGQMVKRAQQQGQVRPDLHADLVVRVLVLVFQQLVTPSTLLELNIKPSDMIDQIIDLFFYGMLTPNAADQKNKGLS